VPIALDAAIGEGLSGVSPTNLRAFVEMLAFPRSYDLERRANRKARDFLLQKVRSFGYRPFLQGATTTS
jgi:hypothetical protein